MTRTFLLHSARQLLTLGGHNGIRCGAAMQNLGVIEDGAVLIRDDRIEAVGPTRRIENLTVARGAEKISAHGQVVMPAFVDAEFRGLHARLPTGTPPGYRELSRTEAARLLDRTLTALRNCVTHGTTTVELKTGGTLHSLATLGLLRSVAKLEHLPVRIVPTFACSLSLLGGSGEQLQSFAVALARAWRQRSASSVELQCDGSGDRHLPALAALVGQSGLAGKLAFAGPITDDAARWLHRTRARAISLLSPTATGGLARLNGFRGVVTVPVSSEWIGASSVSGCTREFLNRGGALALGSGYGDCALASVSMQAAVARAVSALRLTPEEAITGATIHAALAAGCEAERGSLERGKLADLVMFNFRHYRELIQQPGVNHATLVLRNGKIVAERPSAKV